PSICHWNLVRFAETLLPLLHAEESEAIRIATEILEGYPALFETHWLVQMGRKIGLEDANVSDKPLIDELLQWISEELIDYTTFFSQLTRGFDNRTEPFNQSRFLSWHETWQTRLKQSGRPDSAVIKTMENANPYIIPRNHRVEEALEAATYRNDLDPLHRLLKAIRSPYEATQDNASYVSPPAPTQQVYQTFCGT
ncbi:MAG: protein adenylyltransferase SelO family protein, partial [Pirellula sp.]|nr:protein adenylyltransferase SelO family protein [Pirellula sp.]